MTTKPLLSVIGSIKQLTANVVFASAAGPDFRVQLKFLYFHLEASENCKYDSLEIRDGMYGFSPLLFRGCCK